ncbi:MAG: glycosyltransferase family 4 protein [Nitrospinae bacterium]|nr:glycosyltransferase family 4 protein [Nitrospinota bacterium]
MSLKIGVDARELELNPRGVGRVLLGLLQEWRNDSRGHSFILYFKETVPPAEVLDAPHFEKKVLAVPRLLRRHRVWEQVFLPEQMRRDRLDVFFSPSYTIPLRANCPAVTAIHDISFETHPEWYGFRHGLTLRWFARQSASRAARVVCGSHSARKEILAHYRGLAADKIAVVHYAPDRRFRVGADGPDAAFSRLAARYKIERPYFLFVGSLLLRRNIPELLSAFRRATEKHPGQRLVLIGNDDELQGLLRPTIEKLGLTGRVAHFNYVAEEDLADFYRAAFCFVHPSGYEGFALPVVEAMACGTPVIIANAEAMAEVAGGAARVADPVGADGLAEAMTELVENRPLREEMVRKGLERAGQFGWDRAAAAFLDLIEDSARQAL